MSFLNNDSWRHADLPDLPNAPQDRLNISLPSLQTLQAAIPILRTAAHVGAGYLISKRACQGAAGICFRTLGFIATPFDRKLSHSFNHKSAHYFKSLRTGIVSDLLFSITLLNIGCSAEYAENIVDYQLALRKPKTWDFTNLFNNEPSPKTYSQTIQDFLKDYRITPAYQKPLNHYSEINGRVSALCDHACQQNLIDKAGEIKDFIHPSVEFFQQTTEPIQAPLSTAFAKVQTIASTLFQNKILESATSTLGNTANKIAILYRDQFRKVAPYVVPSALSPLWLGSMGINLLIHLTQA